MPETTALSAILRTPFLKLEFRDVALLVDGLPVLAYLRFFERDGFPAKGALDERIKYSHGPTKILILL